jgi:hypothetical protein
VSAATPPPRPRAARGSYLDQLLAEPTETSSREVHAPVAAPAPDPQWLSWWDTAEAQPTPGTLTGPPTAVHEPIENAPVRAPRFARRSTTGARRGSARVPAGQRSRLPGRGVHVPRRGPAWSSAVPGPAS